jgi:putative membrane protein
MSMFSKAEAERVAAVVGEVEQRTAGEIVVAEVPTSDDYGEVRLFAAVVLGLLAAAGTHVGWPALPVGAVLAIQFGAGVVAWLISGLSPVLRAMLPRGRAEHAVARAAELAFLEHGLFATRDRTGVLIFLSELEHRVVILGDKGIHERIQNPGWSELVTSLVAAIKQRRTAEGVCSVITRLGETLARDAPVRPDDTNELPNYVRGPSERA